MVMRTGALFDTGVWGCLFAIIWKGQELTCMFEMQCVVTHSDKQNYLLLKSKIICFTSVRCDDVHRKQIIFGKWRQDFLW